LTPWGIDDQNRRRRQTQHLLGFRPEHHIEPVQYQFLGDTVADIVELLLTPNGNVCLPILASNVLTGVQMTASR
jgi:hypothetical protein